MLEAFFEHATDGIILLEPCAPPASVEAVSGAAMGSSPGVDSVVGALRVIRCNTSAAALLGLDTEQSCGQSLTALLPEAPQLAGHLARALAVGRAEFEFRPNVAATNLPAEAIRIGQGLAVTVRRPVVIPEIADEPDAARPDALALSHQAAGQRAMRLFIENTPVPVAMLDNDLRYIACSRRWLEDYNLLDQDIRGRRHYEVFPNVPPHWRDVHARCLAGAFEQSDNDVLRLPNGREIRLRWEVRPWYNESGAIGGLVMLSEDITDRVRARSERDRFRDHLYDCIESVQGGIVLYDADSRLVLCNSHYREMYREAAAEMVPGRTYREILDAYARRSPGACGDRTPEAWVEYRLQQHATRREPWEQYVNGRWILVQDQDTADGGVVSLRTDITEIKKTQEALHQAKEAAEQADLSKSAFLANMSHEIRTPMTAILGYADLLDESRVSAAEHRDHVATIRRNGENLIGIIDDILDLSKIETGQLVPQNASVFLPGLMQEMHDLMLVRADAKGIRYELAPVFPLPTHIEIDAPRLRQILVNLIGNAIKFTETGTVTVRIAFDAAAGELICDVIDTGIGVPPEALQAIFEPFIQADNSMTRRFGGAGLGLAISRRLAQMLGGDLTVCSEPGRGSTFRLRVPTRGSGEGLCVPDRCATCPITACAHKPPVQISLPAAAANADVEELPARLLLVEDGPDNQRLIAFHLRKAGFKVQIAENGQVALYAIEAADAESTPFDLVLLDMQMPVMDGYQTVTAMRRAGDNRPVIALTAHAMEGDREKCLAAGCDDYMTKPVKKDALIELVRQMLRQNRLSHQTPASDDQAAAA